MPHVRLALLAALAFGTSVVQASDLMDSPRCREALDALHAQEAREAAAKASGAEPTRGVERSKTLESLRRHAARVCLGGRGEPLTPTNRPAPPSIGQASTTLSRPPGAARLPAAPPVPAPAPPEAPLLVMRCDAGGCWASDGSRLPRLGPNLLGPRGMCTVQGMLVQCP